LKAYERGSVFTLVLVVVCTLLLYRARARGAHDPEGGDALASVAHVLHAPVATALLLALFVSRPLRPDPPLALQHTILPFMFAAAVVLLRSLVDPRLVPALYALGVLLVVDLVRVMLFAVPGVEQIVLIVEMAAAAALLSWVTARASTAPGALARWSPWLPAASRALFRAVAIAAALAAVAAALGYLELADLVGGGGVLLVFVTITLLALRIAVGGVVGLALLM